MEEILRKITKLEATAKKNVDTLFSGRYKSVFKGSGLDFDEVRLYQIGDPFKLIDWKTSARMRKPYVKIFREEHEIAIFFLFDVSASMQFDNKSEIALEIFASLAYAAMKNQDKFGLIAFSDKTELFFKNTTGRKNFLHILQKLTSLTPEHKTSDIYPALESLNRLLKRRSIVIVLSDFLFPLEEKVLYPIVSKHETIFIRLFSPKERLKRLQGILSLKDLETGKKRWLSAISPKQQNELVNFFERLHERLTDFSEKYGIDYISLSTEEAYLPKLQSFFRLRPSVKGNLII